MVACVAGCSDGSSPQNTDGAIACGYYIERGTYAIENLQVIDFASETTWTIGLPLSRHARNPAGAFAWIPLSQPMLLKQGPESVGGLGAVSNDARCNEALSLFSDIEPLTNDPDGFTDVEQQAELSVAVPGFTFPSTLAAAEAMPDSQDATIVIVADLTRDKTKLVGSSQVRQQIARQTARLSAKCDHAPQVTRRWVAMTERDDPALCRAGAGGTECAQLNLVFGPERCTLASERVTLQLPSGKSEVTLGGALMQTRSAPSEYSIRIDDIRLFGTAR